MWYQFLNIFFFIIHTALTLFNIVGWAFPKTRKLHLITTLLLRFSCFVFGICYGWGYFACTDLHWQVRETLGYNDRSDSYIHFLLLHITGKDFSKQFVNTGTLIVFLLTAILSVWLNIRDWKKKRK